MESIETISYIEYYANKNHARALINFFADYLSVQANNLLIQRRSFSVTTALLKALYLASYEAIEKWTMPLRNWGKVYGKLSIRYEGRLPE